MLNSRLSSSGNGRAVREGNSSQSAEVQRGQHETQQTAQPSCPRRNGFGPSVQQEMARSFPGLFRKEAKGKRRFAPYARPPKSFLVNFFLLDRQRMKTPKGDDELKLLLAGLGKRTLTVAENTTHLELTDFLLNAYPRLGGIVGGWLLHKSTGGGGQRKLVIIPPDADGYSGQQIKAVAGNGKCMVFIVPLQDEIDTTPLPPEAKEFQNMPKAPCANCRKMFPLQSLPFHIKVCQEENIDLCSSEEDTYTEDQMSVLSPECEAEMTAECPLCKGKFSTELIESHASDCGLRTADQEGNSCRSSEATNSFKSLEDILNWVSSQVDESSTFQICVSRSDLYSRGLQQFQRQKKSSPKYRLRVSFLGENGIDTGALSKEFLTEMVAEIEQKLFIGGMDNEGKNPLYCLGSLDNNYFRTAGEIIAASIAQGGPAPNFMREWCYRYLCSGDSDGIQVTPRDVTDWELSELIMKINRATTETMNELTDDIVSCGYTGKVAVDKKDIIIRAVVLHSTIRVVPMLDQLRKGLQLYDLLRVLKMHSDLCLPLFVPGENDKVDAAFILEKCQPNYNEKGSVKYSREVNIMNFFQDFLQEIEDHEQDGLGVGSDVQQQLTVGRILQWMTGQAHKPLLPSEKKDFIISVRFFHDCDTHHTICFPTVSACSRTITFPVAHLGTLTEFKSVMETALSHGQSFYMI